MNDRSSEDILKELHAASSEVGEEADAPYITADDPRHPSYEASRVDEDDGDDESLEADEEEEEIDLSDLDPEDPTHRIILANEKKRQEIEAKQAAYIQQMRMREREWEGMPLSEKFHYYKNYGAKPAEWGVDGDQAPQFSSQDAEIAAHRMKLDREDLVERYGEPLIEKFAKDFERGKIKVKEGDFDIPNLHESLFLTWVEKSGEFAKLNNREMGNFLEAASGAPLECRSLEFLFPQKVRPAPKPRSRSRGPRVSSPEINEADAKEMLGDFMRKHPEKFQGRR